MKKRPKRKFGTNIISAVPPNLILLVSTLRLMQAQDMSRCQPEKLTAIFSRSASKGISCLGEDCLAPTDSSLTSLIKQPVSFVNAFRGFSITKSIALWLFVVKWFFKKFAFCTILCITIKNYAYDTLLYTFLCIKYHFKPSLCNKKI